MPWQCEWELSVRSNLIYSDTSLETLNDFDKEDKKSLVLWLFSGR